MNVRCICAIAAFVLPALLPAAEGNADEWVAKARAYYGSESALNAVNSIHFEGTVETTERIADPADASKMIDRPIQLTIGIVFQKPMQQRQIIRSGEVERVTSLDGYDAWEKVSDRTNKNPSRITLLDSPRIKRLRATTIDNLSFYSNKGQDMREVRLLGDVNVDGIACVKLSFTYSSIVFIRYFEKSTGRLVRTDIDGGDEIREEGEIFVSGIRFPRKVVNKSAGGQVTVITFDKVTVGERFPSDVFAVPSMQTR